MNSENPRKLIVVVSVCWASRSSSPATEATDDKKLNCSHPQVIQEVVLEEGVRGEFSTYIAWTNRNNRWVKVHDTGWWAYENNDSKHESPVFAVEQQLDNWIAANPL